MSEATRVIKDIKCYPDTNDAIDAAEGDRCGLLDIIVFGVVGTYGTAPDRVTSEYCHGDITQIQLSFSDPHGDRLELNTADYIDDLRADIINLLFTLELIDEHQMEEYKDFDDAMLCRKTKNFMKKDAGARDGCTHLVEDLQVYMKASRRNEKDNLVITERGNLYFGSDVDVLKFFVSQSYGNAGGILVDDLQVNRFLATKGKELLRQFKDKTTRKNILSQVQDIVRTHQEIFPEAYNTLISLENSTERG